MRCNPITHMDYTPPSFAVIDARGGTAKNGYRWLAAGRGTPAMPGIAPQSDAKLRRQH